MSTPYWQDETCALHLGDCREILPALGVAADCIVADPPYGETSLPWDRWPEGWLDAAALTARSLWCFGSLRMYLDHHDDFAGWNLSQDVIWEKHSGSGFHKDRFRRVHEQPTHWYQGTWAGIYHEAPTTPDKTPRAMRSKRRPTQTGHLERGAYESTDGGPRLVRSVIYMRSMHGRALEPTEKPVGLLDPLIRYACPPGGLVVDPFAGSGATLDAARCAGRRAIGIELREEAIEKAARRLSQMTLEAS